MQKSGAWVAHEAPALLPASDLERWKDSDRLKRASKWDAIVKRKSFFDDDRLTTSIVEPGRNPLAATINY
jgi:hypothetical protein